MNQRPDAALAVAIALLALGCAVFAWPIVPIDETRYVSVAWEMWLKGDFILPRLNGEIYSHKPPLLFWLFQLGWWLFGVNDWWPRVVPALCACACIPLTASIARELWPEHRAVRSLAPAIAQSTFLWCLFTTAIMFDMLLALCTLIGLAGVVRAGRGARGAWIVCGVGVGLGILAKGPVALLHVFVPAMLVRFWASEQRPRWTHWTMGMLLALAIAAGIALAWALPAALRGGAEYRAAIFWGQSAGRVVESMAHRHPFWWYVPMLPLLVFPWWLYPRAWRGVHALFRSQLDSGTRFCLTWIVSIVALFSLISGKQLQYLLPLVPAFALMLARALTSEGSPSTIASEPSAGSRVKGPLAFALGSGGAFAIISVAGMQFLAPPGLDVTGVARYLKRLEDEGRPVAHVGKYYGQYQFIGRLERPLPVVQPDAIRDWIGRNPEGRAIVYLNKETTFDPAAGYSQPYRGRRVAVLDRQALLRFQAQLDAETP